MRRNTIISSVLAAVFVGVVLVALQLSSSGSPDAESAARGSSGTATAATQGRLVREDSHRLQSVPDGKVTFVGFLDFECESCRAAYPVVEQLRKDYADKVSFVIRYFPIQSHTNAVNAAVAVEAAAQQGKLEQMYKRMYETQSEWGEKQTSEAARFRSYALVMGLDMNAYDAAVTDPKTLARVEKDRQDGLALGVQGTPTFFLNGKQLRPSSEQEFRAEIDAALAGAR